MADNFRLRALVGHYKRAKKSNDANITFYMTDDVGIWYVLIHDLDDEFKDGEYLVKMVAHENYPYTSPRFYFLTPNGVYGIDGKVCISIGEFHENKYPPHIGMDGFARQLISGMVCYNELGSGIRIVTNAHSKKDREDLAKRSKQYNKLHYPDIIKKLYNERQNKKNQKQEIKQYGRRKRPT